MAAQIVVKLAYTLYTQEQLRHSNVTFEHGIGPSVVNSFTLTG